MEQTIDEQRSSTSMKSVVALFLLLVLALVGVGTAAAVPFRKLDKPPLKEQWFGIYVDNERVGFYRQKIVETVDGYRIESDSSASVRVMGFSKQSTTREIYQVGKNLVLRSLEVEQVLNGVLSRVSGKVHDSTLLVRDERAGKIKEKKIRFKGEIIPGPALNIYPPMRDGSSGRNYKLLTFDPEELKVKDVKVSVLGDEKTPDGRPALKLRNDLYPFVNNDIWVDDQGNTLLESVREGLVTTRAEEPRQLAAFIGNLAIARKDLIYDFSLVRAEPPLKGLSKLSGLAVEISGWSDALPLLQEGGQFVEKAGNGRITVRTGTAVTAPQTEAATAADSYLKPAEMIESDAPEIKARAREIAAGKNSPLEVARALATWTSNWLKDTVNDGGGALASLKERSGNCQTHARLYTALARAAGIPTRFVSGLVALEGKGFLYHSWAESRLDGRWVAIDPTYNQVPADPTHLKFFLGHTQDDLAPIIAIIGKISIKVLEAKY